MQSHTFTLKPISVKIRVATLQPEIFSCAYEKLSYICSVNKIGNYHAGAAVTAR